MVLVAFSHVIFEKDFLKIFFLSYHGKKFGTREMSKQPFGTCEMSTCTTVFVCPHLFFCICKLIYIYLYYMFHQSLFF